VDITKRLEELLSNQESFAEHSQRTAALLVKSPELRAIVFHPEGFDIGMEGIRPFDARLPDMEQFASTLGSNGNSAMSLRRVVLVDKPDGEEPARVLNKATIGLVMSRHNDQPDYAFWSLWVRGLYPWTPPAVGRLLETVLGPPDGFSDISGAFPAGRAVTIGPGPERTMIGSLMVHNRREVVIIGHAPSTRRREYYERAFRELAPQYRSSCIFVVYDDPRGVARRQHIHGYESERDRSAYALSFPDPGGAIAWLPPQLHTDALPPELSAVLRMMSPKEAGDREELAAWVKRWVEMMWSVKWPRMTSLTQDVAKQIEEFLPQVAIPDSAEQLANTTWKLSKAIQGLQEKFTEVKNIQAQQASAETRHEHDTERLTAELDRERQLRRAADEEVRQRGQRLAQLEGLCSDYEARLKVAEAVRTEELLAENARLREDQEAALACAAEAEERLGSVERELRRRPPATSSPAVHRTPKQAVLGPKDWDDLVAKAHENLPWIALPDSAVDVARRQLRGHRRYVATSWKTLVILDAYGETKARTRSQGLELGPDLATLYAFLTRYPVEGLPPSRVLLSESTEVAQNPRMREQRMFPGPAGERVFMQSNIVIARGGPPAPRLHYFDDTDGESGLIWVGYIGPHLRNTLT
jgi:hypothetical protein